MDMQKIILTIKDNSKLSFFLKLMKQLDFVEVEEASFKRKPSVKKHNFFASAGLWKNRDINADELREKAWKRSR